jgi:hypothetical protein
MGSMRRSLFVLGLSWWGCSLSLAAVSATTAHTRPTLTPWNTWEAPYRTAWPSAYDGTTHTGPGTCTTHDTCRPPDGALLVASGHEPTQDTTDDPCERDPSSQECYCQSYPDDPSCSGAAEEQTTQEVGDAADTSDTADSSDTYNASDTADSSDTYDTSGTADTGEDYHESQDTYSEHQDHRPPGNVPTPNLNIPEPRWGTGQGPLQGDVPWYQRFQNR